MTRQALTNQRCQLWQIWQPTNTAKYWVSLTRRWQSVDWLDNSVSNADNDYKNSWQSPLACRHQLSKYHCSRNYTSHWHWKPQHPHHSLTHSFIHSFTHSIIHSFISVVRQSNNYRSLLWYRQVNGTHTYTAVYSTLWWNINLTHITS